MLKFFLDKLRDRPGPLKQVRLVIGDIVEELFDIASHYIRSRKADETTTPLSTPQPQPSTGETHREPEVPVRPSNVDAKGKKAFRKETSLSGLELFPDLTPALQSPANRKKQEFKVLAILWDADRRGMGELSAMDVADHGVKIGLVIRHENIRKVIRMQLSGYVESVQNRKKAVSIQQYRITHKGIAYFEQKYLQKTP